MNTTALTPTGGGGLAGDIGRRDPIAVIDRARSTEARIGTPWHGTLGR